MFIFFLFQKFKNTKICLRIYMGYDKIKLGEKKCRRVEANLEKKL